MNDEAARTLAEARRKVERFVADLTGHELVDEWSEAATPLYKEQYELKTNPYGEAWAPKPGDQKRTKSSWRFGKLVAKDGDSFSLFVAKPNGGRSCVPYEPRGLGRWRETFQKILTRRAEALVGSVR